ncbi:MAG: 50S ribosomal protein L28 [Planctomycetes bacterium]|nr:50S ribosomal protein L28 [Planctomycetota bacterium]
MSRVCDICGKKQSVGYKYARRGLPKKVGGIGLKVTGRTKRTFNVNLQLVRVRDDAGRVAQKRVCAKCLKNGLRKGTIMKAARGSHSRYLKEKAAAEENAGA